ncbi:MAG: class F sortase [Cohnella sp.]|nr:class F sortase [Cohnella sp.]
MVLVAVITGCTHADKRNLNANQPNSGTQIARQVEISGNDKPPLPNKSLKSKPYPNGITPSRLYIPVIDLHANIESVEVLDNGQMGVPNRSDTVGYLPNGIWPGAVGNAVLDGHYDSRTGPAVFYRLKQLKAGDIIIVKNERGEAIEFAVRSVQTYGKSAAPIPMIFGPTSESRLNLITCAGKFSRKLKEHQERLVVFAARL